MITNQQPCALIKCIYNSFKFQVSAIKHQYQMPTNTSLRCNNHFNTITQAVIVQCIKSGPTNATLAPFNYTQFGTLGQTIHMRGREFIWHIKITFFSDILYTIQIRMWKQIIRAYRSNPYKPVPEDNIVVCADNNVHFDRFTRVYFYVSLYNKNDKTKVFTML